ncbi:hypothetical protein BTW32_30415 [Bacillus thuringiensis]|nr:hypothetical protein BTW32_30415 [Bacillus thuringiensis]
MSLIFEGKDITDVLSDFQNKIDYSLNNTGFHERQDLEQDLKIKIMEKLMSLNLDTTIPGFWEFISSYM